MENPKAWKNHGCCSDKKRGCSLCLEKDYKLQKNISLNATSPYWPLWPLLITCIYMRIEVLHNTCRASKGFKDMVSC